MHSPINLTTDFPFAMDITSQVDPMYWGVMLSTVIFGVNIAQGWVYVNTNNDPWHLRLLVAVIFILDLVTTCLNYQFLRYYLMSNYGNPIAFLELIPSVIAVIVTTISIAYLTQIFVVSRIYLLDKHSPWVSGVLMFFSTGALVAVTFEVHAICKDPIVFLSGTKDQLRTAVGLGLTAITELITTAVLLRKLSSSNTYFKKTQSLLLRLMLWVATRCLFVTVNQIILLVVYITQMQSLNWMPLLMLEPKLHVITIVAILNSRTPQPTESKTNNMPMSSALNFRRPFHSRMNTSLVDRSHSTKPQFMHFAIPDATGEYGDVLDIHPRRASQISQKDFASIEVTVIPSKSPYENDTPRIVQLQGDTNRRDVSVHGRRTLERTL